MLSPYFYNFLKTNLKTKSKFLRQKIVDADIENFLKGKLGLTCEYIKYFLPKNADKLPSYQPWDYKIKIIPWNQAPYYKNRQLLSAKFSYIKK